MYSCRLYHELHVDKSFTCCCYNEVCGSGNLKMRCMSGCHAGQLESVAKSSTCLHRVSKYSKTSLRC